MSLLKTDHLTPKPIPKEESLRVYLRFCDRTILAVSRYVCLSCDIILPQKPNNGKLTPLYPS